MDEAEMRRRVAAARVGRLCSLGRDGRLHAVPFCFALDGDAIVSAVDDKPKRSRDLRRLDNVRANPGVAVLVDHYDDRDWSRLWWVRVRGHARVLDGDADSARAGAALTAKYPQYRERPPAGPFLAISPREWRGWSAS